MTEYLIQWTGKRAYVAAGEGLHLTGREADAEHFTTMTGAHCERIHRFKEFSEHFTVTPTDVPARPKTAKAGQEKAETHSGEKSQASGAES